MPDDLLTEVQRGTRPEAEWANRVVRAVNRAESIPDSFSDSTGTYVRRQRRRKPFVAFQMAGIADDDANTNISENVLAAVYINDVGGASTTDRRILIHFDQPVFMARDDIRLDVPIRPALAQIAADWQMAEAFDGLGNAFCGELLETQAGSAAGSFYANLLCNSILTDFDITTVTWNTKPATAAASNYSTCNVPIRVFTPASGAFTEYVVTPSYLPSATSLDAHVSFVVRGSDSGGPWVAGGDYIYGMELKYELSTAGVTVDRHIGQFMAQQTINEPWPAIIVSKVPGL